MNTRYLSMVVIWLLLGCDIHEQSIKDQHPRIFLSAGVTVQISNTRYVRVFGNDKCPDNSYWLFGGTGATGGCTLLSGKSSVYVTLESTRHNRISEIWQVKRSDSLKTIELVRPNGWVIKGLKTQTP